MRDYLILKDTLLGFLLYLTHSAFGLTSSKLLSLNTVQAGLILLRLLAIFIHIK